MTEHSVPETDDAIVRPATTLDAERWAEVEPAMVDDATWQELLARLDGEVPLGELLRTTGRWCRACGADGSGDDGTCTACGRGAEPLPALYAGPLGATYGIRRRLRKRLAICVGVDESSAHLLFPDGETISLPLADMPEPMDPGIPDDRLAPVRSARGRLLRLAVAGELGLVSTQFALDPLLGAACAGIDDEVEARMLAADAVAIDRVDLLDYMAITETERDWLRATAATRAGDAELAVASIVRLPADRYRAKLTLIAKLLSPIADRDLDTAGILAQVRPFADDEPLAALAERLLCARRAEPLNDDLDVASVTEHQRELVGAMPLPPQVQAPLEASTAAVRGDRTRNVDSRYLPRHVRALLGLVDDGAPHVRGADLSELPLELVDDLADAGTLDADAIDAAPLEGERATYLRARVAPERLSDDEVLQLEHVDEQARRAFSRADDDALTALGDDEIAAHYRQLRAVARGRVGDVDLDSVVPEARGVVEHVLSLIAEVGDGARLGDVAPPEVMQDPTAWPILVDRLGASALEVTSDIRERFPAFTEWLSLHHARAALFAGDWPRAVSSADQTLALAENEAVRDEALNLKACGLYELGRHEEAIDALQLAIEGEYSEALLSNVSLVAQHLRPELATEHLGRIMVEARSTPMRVAAAHRALAIWSTSDTSTWRNSDESPMPDAFQEPLRKLVVADIPLDDFRAFARALAINDAEWLGDAGNLRTSPHAASLDAEFYVARAHGPIRMIEVIGRSLKQGDPPDWLIAERDSLREAAVEILFENLDEPDSQFGAVALTMVDEQVLNDPYDHFLLSFLGIASVTYHLGMQQEMVGDQLVERFHVLRKDLASTLESDQRDRLEPIVELATRRVAINRMAGRSAELSDAIDLYNGALDLGRYAEVGSPRWREAMHRVEIAAAVARMVRDDLREWIPLVDHKAVRDDLESAVNEARELERRCINISN